MLIRHGQSIGNQKELFYGSSDYELTAKGIKQAQQMRETLSKVIGDVDTVTSSTKKRALETAKIVFGLDYPLESLKDGFESNQGKLRFRVDRRFDEYDLGGLEGINVSGLTYAEQE